MPLIFDLVCGFVTIASAVFSVVIYIQAKQKESVETERINGYKTVLQSVLASAQAVAKQNTLSVALADREDVTKKELKHLLISTLSSVEALADIAREAKHTASQWSYGVPSKYLEIGSKPPTSEVAPEPIVHD